MSFLDHLFGRKHITGGGTPSRSGSPSPGQSSPRAPDARRPFEIIGEAEQRWKVGDSALADNLFRQGIDAYTRRERSGLGFALGRYGAFLIDQERIDDAATVLEQAIAGKTDIPAIWSDYLRIAADRRSIDAFTRGIERMIASVRYRVDTEFVLTYARRADREGASGFAEAVAKYAVERATREVDRAGRWAAIGDLGRILERANRADEAVQLWRSAFDEGSTDGETISRLSMQLERAKDYSNVAAVLHDALTRDLPANVKESLRKRLARCEEKIGGQRPTTPRKRADVPTYSVRDESTQFEPVFQIRLKPPIKDLEVVGGLARCLLVSKESSTLVDVDLTTGKEKRRVESLPVLGDTWFAPDGRGIGIRRTAAVGKGPTLLRFLDAEGRVASESEVPDATSEVALGPDLWYVGCRNGLLYAFGFDGKQRWSWETPGSKNHDGTVYFRPCPYYVASRQSFAAVASMGNIYAVGSDGRTMWHAELPNERQTRWEFTVPLEGDRGISDAYKILGLASGAPRDQIKSAYRRLALQTHPDRNPDNNDAAARFRQVQGAYERVLVGPAASAAGTSGITISMEIHGIGPMASFVNANSEGVVVGSSQGRLYRFDATGRLQEARILGDGPVRAALRADGNVGAAWCSDALLFLKHGKVVNAAAAVDWPRALTMIGDEVLLWRGNEVHVMDADGRLVWAVEFSKTVNSVATLGDTIVCAAGVLAAFRRSKTPSA